MILNFEEILRENNADCVLINTFDEFLSEYTAKKDNLLFQIVGFSGSNGLAFIGKKQKVFFTDGRYLLQAKSEISDEFEINHIKDFDEIFAKYNIGTVLIDKSRFSAQFCVTMQAKHNVNFTHWKQDIAKLFENNGKFYILPESLTGESSHSKIEKIRKHLISKNADCYYVTDCQNICWLLNIRGQDEDFTPVFKTHLLITKNDVFLGKNFDINSFSKVLVDLQINFENYQKINCQKVFDDFITNLKAIKNDVEIEGIVNVHKIDGEILTNFLHNLENNYKGLSEFEVGENLLNARKQSEFFKFPSFASICGYNQNGAIIHYNATKNNAKVLDDGIFLLDSGGQYCDLLGKQKILGTTDVTRTICLGSDVDEEYKKVFTLVLKGHIAVAKAEFPQGTTGKEIDILARKPLIEVGLNYDHGTGHGVGAFLSVHEGGVGISPRNTTILKEGMLISNEPGCYLEGKFGVRIENLVLVVKKQNNLLGFKTLTLVPIQERSINFTMLASDEKIWVEEYNNLCLKNAKR